MITTVTTILVAGLVAVIVVTAHEMFEHVDRMIERPGTDEQWRELADAMRRYRKHKARRRGRSRHVR